MLHWLCLHPLPLSSSTLPLAKFYRRPCCARICAACSSYDLYGAYVGQQITVRYMCVCEREGKRERVLKCLAHTHTHKHTRARACKLNEILSNKTFYVTCKITQCNPQALHAAHFSLTLHSTAHASLTLHSTSLRSLSLCPLRCPRHVRLAAAAAATNSFQFSFKYFTISALFHASKSASAAADKQEQAKYKTTTIKQQQQEQHAKHTKCNSWMCRTTRQRFIYVQSKFVVVQAVKNRNYFVDTFPHTHIHIVDLVCFVVLSKVYRLRNFLTFLYPTQRWVWHVVFHKLWNVFVKLFSGYLLTILCKQILNIPLDSFHLQGI